MNKRKELLWFLIPFVVLPIAGIFGSLCEQVDMTPQFLGVENYFLLYINDPMFWISVWNTIVMEWVFTAVLALVLGLVVRWMRVSRYAKYVMIFVTAIVATALMFWVSVRLMPRWYNLLNFVKYGNAAAFFAWLAERIWLKKKAPKQECEIE